MRVAVSGIGGTTTLVNDQQNTILFTAGAGTSTTVTISRVTGSTAIYYLDHVELAEDHLYDATVKMSSDYYPFGMQMPGRNNNSGNYRFGYNGMEMDNEAKGNGNSYTTEFRQYDPRMGRWLSLDPLMMMFPNVSPYCAFDNNPVYYTDPYGLAPGNGDPVKKTGTYEENVNDIEKNLPGNAKNGDILSYTFEGGDYEKVDYKKVDGKWEVLKYRKAGDRYSSNSHRLQNHPKTPSPEGEPILIAKDTPPTPTTEDNSSGDEDNDSGPRGSSWTSIPPSGGGDGGGSGAPPTGGGGKGGGGGNLPPPDCENDFDVKFSFNIAWGDIPKTSNGLIHGLTPEENWKKGTSPVSSDFALSNLKKIASNWVMDCNHSIYIHIYTPADYKIRHTSQWGMGGRSTVDLLRARADYIKTNLINFGIPSSAFSPYYKWMIPHFGSDVIDKVPIKILLR